MNTKETFVRLARVDEILEGESRSFDVGGDRVLVCKVDGTLYAIEDVCTHDGSPFEGGMLIEHRIECPRHGARFDVRTGAVLRMPAAAPVRTFPLRIEGDEIYLAVGETED